MAKCNSIWSSSVYGVVIYMVFQVIFVFTMNLPIMIFMFFKGFFTRCGKNIKGKTVLITGSARGLGKALAFEFAKKGCKVICADINKSLNEDTVEEINEAVGCSDTATAITCDVSDFESVQKLRAEIYKNYDTVDILVNNAGIVYTKPGPNDNEADMTRKVVHVNLLSCYWLVQTFLPKMKENNSGHLVFINSVSSLIPLGDATIYTSTKYGLLGFTDALMDEFSRTPSCSNIKISSAHPFFVKTEGLNTISLAPKQFMMEPEIAASLIVRGVRREYKKFTVPGDEFIFWLMSLSRIIPLEIYQQLFNRLYTKVQDENLQS